MDDLAVGHLIVPGSDLEERFETSGGPGGQHANRSETAVRLRLNVPESSLPNAVKAQLIKTLGGLVEVTASEERSQLRNREIARQRLAEKIEAALREPKKRRETKPTKASRERRLSKKRARGRTKKQRRPPTLED